MAVGAAGVPLPGFKTGRIRLYSLFSFHPLKLHVLPVEREAAWLLHARGFHGHDNAIARACDRACSGIVETIFPVERKLVFAGDFCLPSAIRRCAVRVSVSGIERDLDRVSGLFNA